MPFKEIKQPSGFIRIKSDGKVIISMSLLHFFKNKTHVKIFHDEDKKLIGLQPNDEGYKLQLVRYCRITCHPLSRITQGEFYPKWNQTLKMLVFSY